MKNVHVVGQSFLYDFKTMYESRGFTLVKTIEEADIIQFTGGADVGAHLYKEHEHPSSYASRSRDLEEVAAYKEAQRLGKFCAGVCRGGQLLNVLNGGSLYQDVSGHGTYQGHNMEDVETGEVLSVTSLHHQMMRISPKARLLGKAEKMLSSRKLHMTTIDLSPIEITVVGDDVEVEACYYADTRSFCYQPHPEFAGSNSPCRNWYFDKMGELYAQV